MKYYLLIAFMSLTVSGCAFVNSKDIDYAKRNNAPVIITGIHKSIDSACGVDAEIRIHNVSGKTIKYVRMYAKPYNSVGDLERSTIGGRAEMLLEFDGPLGSGRSNTRAWGNIWYNCGIKCMEIDRAEIIYIDGKREMFNERIDSLFSRSLSNSCSI